MKAVFCQDDEYREIMLQLDKLMQQAEALPFPQARELVFAILQHFDILHREPLNRLIALLPEASDEIKNALEQDFTFNSLLSLYDLSDKTVEKTGNQQQALNFVPADQVRILSPSAKKEWVAVGKASDFAEHVPIAKVIEGNTILIAAVDGTWLAVENACVGSILPLHLGSVEGRYVICPWHGCRYDLITGLKEGDTESRLKSFPVRLNKEGEIMIEMTL